MPAAQRDLRHITLYVHRDIWEALKELAGEHERSTSAEIRFALARYVASVNKAKAANAA